MILGDNSKSFNPRKKFILDEINTTFNASNSNQKGDVKEVFFIQCITEVTFDTLRDRKATTAPNGTNVASTLNSVTYPAGFVLFGDFYEIVIGTGKALCLAQNLV